MSITGSVVFVSAGPGDPELLTLRGARALRQADVVLTDRLVGPDIVRQHVAPETLVVYVGKEGRSSASTAQKDINELLLLHASLGRRVVRLKGGDSAVFGNLLDELEVLQRYDIPYELVPGVTAAAGAAASLGLPLTARGHSRGIRYLAPTAAEYADMNYWADLAHTTDTLVFYMAGERWDQVVSSLLASGIDDAKGIALVRQATTPFQEAFIHSFEELREKHVSYDLVSPSLIMVGTVLHLATVARAERKAQRYFHTGDGAPARSLHRIH
jgi:uroporphyrin-III C-methyltransferase